LNNNGLKQEERKGSEQDGVERGRAIKRGYINKLRR
jgi:hypothetical protein